MGFQELTLLSEGEIWGNHNEEQLEVIKRYGKVCALTDLAILTGAYVSDYHIEEDSSLKGRTGCQWTRSDDDGNDDVRIVNADGDRRKSYRFERYLVVRPALKSSVIFDKISPNRVRGDNDTEEVEYGEYPQMAADINMQKILENEYVFGNLIKTGKNYTFDSRNHSDYLKGFSGVTYKEYKYQGKKYIRIKANFYLNRHTSQLSNGEYYLYGDYVWVEVSPVRWLIDEKTKTLISKKGLVSGIRYLGKLMPYKGDFSITKMKEYLDNHMSKNLFQTINFKNVEKPRDEIEVLLERIKNITNSLEEDTKNKINLKIAELIKQYKNDLEMSKPKFSLENSTSLSTELTPTNLKNNLKNTLERIIMELSSQENLVNFLNEINNYQSLLNTKLEVPSNVESVEDKILYIISISGKYNNQTILNNLKIILDSIDIFISEKLSKIVTGDINLTTKYEKDLKTILNEKINHLYKNVEKYITILSILNGTYNNNLSNKINYMKNTINSLYSEDQSIYNNELTKLEENITFDFCENKTLKEIENIITEHITELEKKLKPIKTKSITKKEVLNDLDKDNEKSVITSMINDIYNLIEENQVDEETKKEVIEKINSIVEKWKSDIINNNININDKLKIESEILQELAKIKINLELYINKKEEYDEVNKSI